MAVRVGDPRPDEYRLVAALERVGRVEPVIAARAAAQLRAALARTRASRTGDVAWAASGLTPAAYPVELAVSSARRELRCVSEVIAPEDDPADALGRALALAAAAGAPPPHARAVAVLRAHQRVTRLRFGAWLGARHAPGGSRAKVYAELGGDAGWAALEGIAPGARRILGGIGRLRFVGLALDGSGTVEAYCRARDLRSEQVAALCGRAGLGHAAVALTEALTPTPAGRRLGGRNLGVSVALAPSGAVQAMAVFGFAWRLVGDDGAVRADTLARARDERWPSRAIYERLTAPLAGPAAVRPAGRWHGPMSFVLDADGRLDRHIGLAPPPVAASRRLQEASHEARVGVQG